LFDLKVGEGEVDEGLHFEGELEDGEVFVGEVVDFVFPRRYQPAYHRVASDFLALVLERDWVTKKEIGDFLLKTGYSKSTLENKVIPKLVRFGLVKREREITGVMGKGRALILSGRPPR